MYLRDGMSSNYTRSIARWDELQLHSDYTPITITSIFIIFVLYLCYLKQLHILAKIAQTST